MGDQRKLAKKRKSKRLGPSSSLTPDLNLPAEDMAMLVLRDLVSSRVNQIVGTHDSIVDVSVELSKKQKTSGNNSNIRSAAAAHGSPRQAQGKSYV